jgi:hypothetical protein
VSIRQAVVMLAVLLAFACQSFVTQTHNHPLNRAAVGSTIDAGTGDRQHAGRAAIGRQTKPDQPADCPICREYVFAGHYLLPPAIAIAPVFAGVAWLSVLVFVARHRRERSHAWRSRGPPGVARP